MESHHLFHSGFQEAMYSSHDLLALHKEGQKPSEVFTGSKISYIMETGRLFLLISLAH